VENHVHRPPRLGNRRSLNLRIGIIRLSACHVEDELRSGRLVAVLTDWECTGAPPILAFYRKAKPTLPLVRALVEHLAAELRPYNIGPKS